MKINKLARAVTNKRFEKNLSLQAAADEIEVSYLTLWKIENGYSNISYETTRKLAIFLEKTTAEVRELL